MGMDWEQAFHLYQELIASENLALKIKGTFKLAYLSKNAPESVLARTIPLLVGLLGSPLSDLRPLIQEAAAYCLNCFACRNDPTLCSVIAHSGAVPLIVSLLPQSEAGFRKILLKFLRSIVKFDSVNREVVARNGGLEVVINLIASCTDDTRWYLLEILSSMSTLREVRRAIVNLGGLCFLVESAQCGKMVSRARAAQAIGLLGIAKRLRHMLVELGAIPVLVGLLRDGDMPAKLTAGNALGIIVSHVSYIRPVAQAGAIPLYVELLEGPESTGKEIAEDVFCILAVVEENAVLIAEHLVRILRVGDDETKVAAADILWDLSGYKHSRSVVRESGSIPLLLELVQDGNGDVRERASGAVAQLSYDEVDRSAMVDAGVIPIMIDLLQDESEEVKDNAAEALINFAEDPLLRDRVSQVLDDPSFRNMQDRLVQIRVGDEHTVRSLRRMSIERFTWNPEFS